MKPFILIQEEELSTSSSQSQRKSLIWLILLFFICGASGSTVKAIGQGGKAGVIVEADGQVRGPMPFTLSWNLGFIEPLPIINPLAQHTLYAYFPYEVNQSTDPENVRVTPIPTLQLQQGAANNTSNYEFYVSEPVNYEVGNNPKVLFASAFSDFQFQINTNATDLIVKEISVRGPDGAHMAFTDATTNITLKLSDPNFGKITINNGSPSIHLEITDGGLPIPNSTTSYSSAYMTFAPFDGVGQKLVITVKTNKIDYTFETDALDYRMGTTYMIPLRIEVAQPVVNLQWSVSTTTNDASSFTDIDNDETTLVTAPEPVYLQIRPEVRNVDYDSWEIDYTAVPVDYMYPITTPVAETERFDFNQGNAHSLPGTYTYTVTDVRFYNSGALVHSVSYEDDPYKHTIRIEDEEEPETTVTFQWSVSTTTADAFFDVGNFTRTDVTEPTPVYLRINPVVEGPLEFDSWQMTYTADPADYEYPMTPLPGSSPYDFNQGNAHVSPGVYIYTVNSFVLYKEGRIAYEDWGNYRHTINIEKKDDPGPPDPPDPPDPGPYPEPEIPPLPPDPEPDPNPGGWIYLEHIAPLCYAEGEFLIGFVRQNKNDSLFYAIAFTDAAIAVGFENDTVYKALSENGVIPVSVEAAVPKGIYFGYVILWSKEAQDMDLFPFRIEVKDYIAITEQPVDVTAHCEGDGFMLWTEASGEVLSYQWYHNGNLIPGATDNFYEGILSGETTGRYHVELRGYCNTEISDTVNVTMSTLHVLIKWTDVLYITNTDNRYASFQWYKNGLPITQYGTSIYYTDPNGLQGSYSVCAYYANGSYDKSCPLSFDGSTPSSKVSVYPTIVTRNNYITVEGYGVGEGYLGALVEIFNLKGQRVYTEKINSTKMELPMSQPTGVYMIQITAENGRKTLEKVIVK